MPRLRFFSLVAPLVFLLTLFAASSARAQYTAPMDIPSQLPNGSTSSIQQAVISKNGIVAGVDFSADTNCLFLWQSGTVNEFGCAPASIIAGGAFYQVYAVNNAGVIIGRDTNANPFTATANDGVVPAPAPPALGTDPVSGDPISCTGGTANGGANLAAINNSGAIVGIASCTDLTTGNPDNQAILFPAGGGTPIFLGPFLPAALNDSGQVLGADNNGNNFFWSQATGLLSIPFGARSMNNSGQIAGTNGGNDIFLWSFANGFQDLGPCTACSNFAGAYGVSFQSFQSTVINDSGEIVFAYNTTADIDTGSQIVGSGVWTASGGFKTIGSLIVNADGLGHRDYGDPYDQANAVNAGGQIVGQGNLPNGGTQAEYWASASAAPLALGQQEIFGISDNVSGNVFAVGKDGAGNAAVWNLSGNVVGVSQDVVSITVPANNATYSLGQNVTTSFTCSSPDGISSCMAQDSNGNSYLSGQPLVTSPAGGPYQFTVTATSKAGVDTTSTTSFSVASAPTVPASGNSCNGNYNGTFKGNITISAGQSCSFTGGAVTGNIQQNGGKLTLTDSAVSGNVQVSGASTVNITAGTVIHGNLQVQQIPSGSASDQVCGSTVLGDLQFQNNGSAVQIGSASNCPGNTINGNLQIQNNTAAVTAVGNTVGGNLTVQNDTASSMVSGNKVKGNLQDQNNTAPTQVFTNSVGGNLQCQSNSSITGGGNTAKQKQGQCSAF